MEQPMTTEDPAYKATDRQWESATNMVLEDTDSLSAWLYDECINTKMDHDNVSRFARWFFEGRLINDGDFPVKDLLWIVFCEEPELSRHALRTIRRIYQTIRSNQVHENLLKMLEPDEDMK